MKYTVDADLYEGPLPLLVELAKLNLIDIFLIKLVDLTQQYLQQVKANGIDSSTRPSASLGIVPSERSESRYDLNELAEPLPLLGNLMALKARGLLPVAPVAEEEEVPVSIEELERRLKEYEQFKTVAQLLAELHALQHQHFPRKPGDMELPDDGQPPAQAPFDVGITDLMSAFAKVLERATAPVYEVKAEPWTVEMKVQELRMLLAVKRQVRFLDLFTPEKSKLELVVTFLALLELIRQHIARAIQERTFSEIMIAVKDTTPQPTGLGTHG